MPRGFAASAPPSQPRPAKPAADRAAERKEEAKLIAAARAGDAAALELLVRRAAEPALRFSRGFCRDPHEAEDLAQDVLATLLRTLGTFRGEASLSTWTWTVARRACVRRKQRLARQRPLDEAGPVLEQPAPDNEPHRRFERRQLAAALEQAIASLPAAHREVIVLRDVEGLSAAEVSRILGLGERAMKSRLHRARLTLRERLAPFVTGGEAPPREDGCPDTARMLSRYIEGELSPAVCARMEKHVSGCPSCGGACESLRAVLGACRDYGRAKVPAEMRVAVRRAVRDLLAERRG